MDLQEEGETGCGMKMTVSERERMHKSLPASGIIQTSVKGTARYLFLHSV